MWKSSYMSQKLFDNDFYVSFLSWLQITLEVNMIATQDYYSFIDSLFYEIKTEVAYQDFSKDNEVVWFY